MGISEEKIQLVKTNLYEQIADYLEDMILNEEEVRQDEKLPSEQSLAEKFGVSRNVIREALKILKERGLVELRNGAGSYITKPEAGNLSDVVSRIVIMDHIDHKDIYEMRTILETASCRIAAVSATKEDLQKLEDLQERLKNKSMSVEERREADFAFHIAIAEAAGNPLLILLVQMMKNILVEMIEKGIYIEGGIDDAIMRHGKILDALKTGDPAMAEAMMYDHLHVSEQNVENYYKQIKNTPPQAEGL